jgi:DNA-directed RNA polymerase specialized sigma24 family protein
MADRELADRLVAGDEDALADIYDRYAPVVFGLAHWLSGDRGVAEDVTQDVFVSLWKAPGEFDPDRSSLRARLAVSAYHRTLEQLRPPVGREPTAPCQALVLAYFGALPCRSIAAELDAPEGAVKSWLRTGLRELADQLGEGKVGCN